MATVLLPTLTPTIASDLIRDALKEIQVLGEGEVMSAEMAIDGLNTLNRLMDRLANQPLMLFSVSQLNFPLTSAQSFTVGPAGADLIADRPIQVMSAIASKDGVDYDVKVLTPTQWDSIHFKDVDGGPPEGLYYEASSPVGTVFVYPKAPGYTLKMRVLSTFRRFAGLTDVVALPPGYEEAIILALAIRLAPSYQRPVSQFTVGQAMIAMRAIKRANFRMPTLDVSGVTGVVGVDVAGFQSGWQ